MRFTLDIENFKVMYNYLIPQVSSIIELIIKLKLFKHLLIMLKKITVD